ncbi:hypothetical protein C2S53_013930 [Perilla frutescens var. hirtella]|uniref:Uncharacterized protein n=1 Tax=Perilla frutescens var. hirtella TaxID=608512 RepID=A0AAD4J7L2_PERFH|nr:hypothetical protein C2S53_013930 [Perilla frutescens var. hirtella]
MASVVGAMIGYPNIAKPPANPIYSRSLTLRRRPQGQSSSIAAVSPNQSPQLRPSNPSSAATRRASSSSFPPAKARVEAQNPHAPYNKVEHPTKLQRVDEHIDELYKEYANQSSHMIDFCDVKIWALGHWKRTPSGRVSSSPNNVRGGILWDYGSRVTSANEIDYRIGRLKWYYYHQKRETLAGKIQIS